MKASFITTESIEKGVDTKFNIGDTIICRTQKYTYIGNVSLISISNQGIYYSLSGMHSDINSSFKEDECSLA